MLRDRSGRREGALFKKLLNGLVASWLTPVISAVLKTQVRELFEPRS